MLRTALLFALPAAVAAQPLPPAGSLGVARATAVQVDQATQAARIGKEALDRVAPLLTVEPPAAAADEGAWRKKRNDDAKAALQSSKPQ